MNPSTNRLEVPCDERTIVVLSRRHDEAEWELERILEQAEEGE